MAVAEDYRRNAAECARIANRTKDPDAKALLLKMAESWLDLARDVEERESKKSR